MSLPVPITPDTWEQHVQLTESYIEEYEERISRSDDLALIGRVRLKIARFERFIWHLTRVYGQ